MEKVDEEASLEFKWLKKRGRGGKERKVQFYESFVYDGVEYTLYDCVYMYKEGLQEPYIGKLIKIWEILDNKTKKVKVHWFFRPEEISMWLGNIKTLGNEILFASGEGVGLANINPLEAIAGQCSVVCVSKDCRNPQPSDDDLKAADFIFYRTFDVQSCTISDKMEEKVGEAEIKYIFNRKEGESINRLPASTSDWKEENQNTTTSHGEEQPLVIKILPNELKGEGEQIMSVKGDLEGEAMPSEKEKAEKVEAKERNKTSVGSDILHDQSLMKSITDDKKPPKEELVELQAARDPERLKDMSPKKSKAENFTKIPANSKSKHEDELSLNVNDRKASETSGNNLKMAKTDGCIVKTGKDSKRKYMSCEDKDDKDPTEYDKLHDLSLKKIKRDDKKPPGEKVEFEVAQDPERLTDMSSNKYKVESSITSEEKPNLKNSKVLISEKEELSAKKVIDDVLKEIKADVGSFKRPDNKKLGTVQKLSVNTNDNNYKDVVATSVLKSRQPSESLVINKELKGKQSGENKRKLSMMSGSPKVSALSSGGDKKTIYQKFVVSPKPNDKSGWFRRLPWEERLKSAYDQGTAILLHNLDPDYTTREVEDLIWHAFTENCEAKILQRSAVSSPHYCQALIILKTKEASRKILSKLDEECLMLSNERPLVATTCPPISSRKNSNFFGHLAIDKLKTQNQRDMDEAVSTSHFSQPNTIEYDMAMEWFLLQARSKKWWVRIHKQQGNELKKLHNVLVRK